MASEAAVQATVKALVFDGEGRVLLLRERSGVWDLPGGRLEHGESFAECLRRECREEIGVDCVVTDSNPHLAWCAPDKDGNWRVMLCFRVTLASFEFHVSEECEAHAFFDRAALEAIPLYPQTRPLAARL